MTATEPSPRVPLTAELLTRRYLQQHASAEQIAGETGWSSQYVRDRLRQHHIALRPAGTTKRDPPDPAALRRWLNQGLSAAQIADRTSYSPSGIYQLLRRHHLPLPTPPHRAPARDSAATAEQLAALTRLYTDEHLNLAKAAAAFGHGPDWAAARLRAAGISLRRPGARSTHPGGHPEPAALDVDELKRAYSHARLTVRQLATQTGHPAAAVVAALQAAGVEVRQGRRPGGPDPDPTQARQLYTDQHLTLAQTAAQLGCRADRVRAVLLTAGVALRPARRPATSPPPPAAVPLPADRLRELYLGQQLTIAQTAQQLGSTTGQVAAALAQHDIPRRTGGPRPVAPPALPARTLRRLYVDERLDDPMIAALHHTTAWQIKLRRQRLGVSRAPVLPPHPEPPRAPSPEQLQALYVDQHLPLAVLARQHRTATPTVRGWLRDAGIAIRPRTTRTTRTALDTAQLRTLYTDRQWSAAQVAAHLHTTVHLVLRTLHDQGIAVRRGNTRHRHSDPADPPAAQLLANLYTDPQISAVLRRHHVPRRRRPGPIAQRFPTPAPLAPALLHELYSQTGLSARQIELLTGQPHQQILDALHTAGITVRHNHGPSPWTSRQPTC